MVHKNPGTGLSDPRVLRSRQALRNALLHLLEDQAFEQISIRDIASLAGISHVTFYRHQLTKEALLQEIATVEVYRLVALMLPALDASDVRSASIALCRLFVQTVAANPYSLSLASARTFS